MDKLLDINEAAALINVDPETLRRWGESGKLSAVRINERGDRRYRQSDVLKLIKSNQVINYKGYSISWDSGGFLSMPANFGKIGRIIARTEKEWIGFAFAVSGFSSFERVGLEDNSSEKSIEKIKEYIDKNLISDGDVFTFEFENGRFHEVQNPDWWDGKYGKTLVPGLRVEANATHPVTVRNDAWRTILHFNSKQGKYWAANAFWNGHAEYFVWVDSKELLAKGLPNSAKSAEILAVEFGVKRFNETKDKNGDRDITRINENNSAFYDGKWVSNSTLPERLMN